MSDLQPPLTDDNGTTWYRPNYPGRSAPPIWGWTSDPAQAHPAYFAPGAPAPVSPPKEQDHR